ncbi:hypothetical protein ACFL54_04085 [Planctomycetota bacterium]
MTRYSWICAVLILLLSSTLVLAKPFLMNDLKMKYDVPEDWELASSFLLRDIKDYLSNNTQAPVGPPVRVTYDFRVQVWFLPSSTSSMRDYSIENQQMDFNGTLMIITQPSRDSEFIKFDTEEQFAESLDEQLSLYYYIEELHFKNENGNRELWYEVKYDYEDEGEDVTWKYVYYNEYEGGSIRMEYNDKDKWYPRNIAIAKSVVDSIGPYGGGSGSFAIILIVVLGGIGGLLALAGVAAKRKEQAKSGSQIEQLSGTTQITQGPGQGEDPSVGQGAAPSTSPAPQAPGTGGMPPPVLPAGSPAAPPLPPDTSVSAGGGSSAIAPPAAIDTGIIPGAREPESTSAPQVSPSPVPPPPIQPASTASIHDSIRMTKPPTKSTPAVDALFPGWRDNASQAAPSPPTTPQAGASPPPAPEQASAPVSPPAPPATPEQVSPPVAPPPAPDSAAPTIPRLQKEEQVVAQNPGAVAVKPPPPTIPRLKKEEKPAPAAAAPETVKPLPPTIPIPGITEPEKDLSPEPASSGPPKPQAEKAAPPLPPEETLCPNGVENARQELAPQVAEDFIAKPIAPELALCPNGVENARQELAPQVAEDFIAKPIAPEEALCPNGVENARQELAPQVAEDFIAKPIPPEQALCPNGVENARQELAPQVAEDFIAKPIPPELALCPNGVENAANELAPQVQEDFIAKPVAPELALCPNGVENARQEFPPPDTA